jgi:hypothetical protein
MPPEVAQKLSRQQALIGRMISFSNAVKASDFAGLSGSGEKVQYTHVHKSMKVKGGSPPRDYDAVEMMIDFQSAISQQNYDQAIPLYYSLKRLLRR